MAESDGIVLDDQPKESKAETGTLQAYAQDLYEEFRTSNYRQTKLKEIEENRKRYQGKLPPKDFPWPGCSNKTLGLAAIAVDSLEPRIKGQIIGEENFIEAEPVGEEDIGNADGVKEFLHWAVLNNMKMPEHVKPMVHDLLMDSTLDVIPVWHERKIKNKVRTTRQVLVTPEGDELPPEIAQQIPPEILQQYGIQPEMREDVQETESTEFKVVLAVVRMSDAFFPDTWENWDEQPYLRMFYPTLSELKAMSGEGGPYRNITDDLVVDPSRVSADEKDRDQDRKGVEHSQYSKEVRCLECYLKWEDEWTLVTYAIDSGWKEIRKQPLSEVFWHGRKPVHRLRLFPESNESMGTGIVKKVEHFDKGVDDLFNQMIDNGTIEICKAFAYEQVPGTGNLDLRLFPGKGIQVPKGANLKFIEGGVKSPAFIQFIELLLGFFERMTSLMDHTLSGNLGRGGQGTETFSGMNLLVQEGNIKHQYQGESLQESFAKILTDVLTLYAQNMPFDAKRRVFENDEWVFQPLDVQAIQGRYDIRISVSNSSSNKMLNRKEAHEKLTTLGDHPIINPEPLVSDFLKSYGHKDTQAYIRPEMMAVIQAVAQDPSVAQVVQQYMQQKQQQMMEQQIAQEAQANVRRQEIERQVEAPMEQNKLVDQVSESVQRQMIKPAVEQQMVQQLMGAMPMGGMQ